MSAPFMTRLQLPSLNGAKLIELLVQWQAGIAVFLAGSLAKQAADDFDAEDLLVRIHGLSAMRCKRGQPTSLISAVEGPHGGPSTWQLAVRMQGGDFIELEFQSLEVRRAFPGQKHAADSDLDTKIEELLRNNILALVTGDYGQLSYSLGRATPDGIRSAVANYPGTLIAPPPEAFADVNVFAVRGEPGAWRVEMPLWTREEGRSDLWVLMDVRQVGDHLVGYIDDVHVL